MIQILVSYTYEQQKAYLNIYNEYIIRGNITNIGHDIITNTTVSATFFEKNGYLSPYDNNCGESNQLYIMPNQTVEFTTQKKYPFSVNKENFEVNVSY
jgi:hypothetical protein